MDIQGWLQGTADRAPPDPSDGHDVPAFLRPVPGDNSPKVTRYHRKRQCDDSDSSIILLRHRGDNRSRPGSRSENIGKRQRVRKQSSQPEVEVQRGDFKAFPSDGAIIRRPDSTPYRKRARHKTKADRYELKRGSREERHQGKKQNAKRDHRPHRGRDGKRTEDLVQGFKLNTKTKKGRLTLKPDVGAGFFKHGRASAQMDGRKEGLPDLAFNELRFLKDSRNHQDEHHQDAVERKLSNQEKKRDLEREEISAYFSRSKLSRQMPQAVEEDKTSNRFQEGAESINRHDGLAEGSSPILASDKLPAIPYLGFGSKGAFNQSSNSQPLATSYLTWSESNVDQAPCERTGPAVNSTIEAGQLSVSKAPLVTSKEADKAPVLGGKSAAQRGFRKCSNAKGTRHYRGPVNTSNDGTHPTQPRRNVKRSSSLHESTSQSLPRVPPALSQKQALNQNALSSQAESWHTSDILKIRQRLDGFAKQPVFHSRSNDAQFGNADHDKENVEPCSTSPMGKALKAAQHAVASHDHHAKEMRQMADRHLHKMEVNAREVSQGRPRASVNPYDMQGFQGKDVNILGTPRLAARATSPAAGSINHRHWHNPHFADSHDYVSEDEEMLDTLPLQQGSNGRVPRMTVASTDMLSHPIPGALSSLRSASLDTARPLASAQTLSWPRRGFAAARSTSSRNDTMAGHVQLEQEIKTRDEILIDGLEGFWKPNRLY